jgi:kynureninase
LPFVLDLTLRRLSEMQASDLNAPLTTRLARLLASSGETSLSSPSFAAYLDSLDPLAHLRTEFNFPKRSTVWPEEHRAEQQARGKEEDRRESVYLAGNSLGLMPKRTSEMLTEELNVWSSRCAPSCPLPRTMS